MKITHIIPNLEVGGAQIIMHSLTNYACKYDHNVTIISLYKIDSDVISLSSNVQVHHIFDRKHFPKNPLVLLKGYARLHRLLINDKSDIIHTHLFLSKVMLLFVRHKNILSTQHDNSPWWTDQGLKSVVLSWIEGYFNRKKAMINVAISKSVERNLLEKCKVSSNQIKQIYNGIDINAQSKVKENKTERVSHLLFVGRLDINKKGIDILINIIQQLVKTDSNTKLTIVGDGKDRDKIKHLISSKNLNDHICLAGLSRNISEFYTKSSLLIMPSRWEGFGLTAAEASFCGTPVIASNVEGLNEVVVNDYNGFCCAVNDVNTFCKRIEQLCKDDKLYEEFSSNAIKFANKNFTSKVCNQHYLNLYEEMIEARIK